MEKRLKFRKKTIGYLWSATLILGLTACSLESGNKATTEPENMTATTTDASEGMSEAANVTPETKKQPLESVPSGENGGETLSAEDSGDIPQGDPIVGYINSYENHILEFRDAEDEDIILYFNTENALVISPGAPLSAGDMVEVTYTGVQGDAEHPGTATKVEKLPGFSLTRSPHFRCRAGNTCLSAR